MITLFWPVWDIYLVHKGKIPSLEHTQQYDVVKLHQQGIWYRYSAFKRFRRLFAEQYPTLSSAINGYQQYIVNQA